MIDNKIAIKIEDVDKEFRVPDEPAHTLKDYFLHPRKIFSGYKKFQALSDISLEIEKGDFVGIVGKNGSGKSTLLKILAGIYQQDKGDIAINGNLIPFLELGVGFNPELSARENVYLNGAILGMTHKYIDGIFDEIIEFSGLSEFVEVPVKNFSSGMYVRLAFSIAIFAKGDIYLMDEVLAVGDLEFQNKCIEVFQKLVKEGKTIILVTHSLDTVEKYCEKVAFLKNGRLVDFGAKEVVLPKYLESLDNPSDEIDRTRTDNKPHIIRTEFLDKNDNKKEIFNTGDDIKVRVFFEAEEDIKIINYGLTLFNRNDVQIFGTNSFIGDINTSNSLKNKYFEIIFKNIMLEGNRYYFKIGLWGENEAKSYDFLDRSKSFQIVDDRDNIGIVELDYKWVS